MNTRLFTPILMPVLTAVLTTVASAQFRGQEPRPPALSDQAPASSSLMFGFFDPSKLSMSHSVSMSYMSMGAQSIGVSMYTNSLKYRISEPLSVRADISMMMAPFGSTASFLSKNSGSIFLNRAEIDWKPSKDTRLTLQFRQFPYDGGNPYFYGRGISGFYGSMWDD